MGGTGEGNIVVSRVVTSVPMAIISLLALVFSVAPATPRPGLDATVDGLLRLLFLGIFFGLPWLWWSHPIYAVLGGIGIFVAFFTFSIIKRNAESRALEAQNREYFRTHPRVYT